MQTYSNKYDTLKIKTEQEKTSFLYRIQLVKWFWLFLLMLNSPLILQAQDVTIKPGVASYLFFKNNEYFSPVVKGYTLPGMYFSPFARLSLSDDFTLSAGVSRFQLYGSDTLSQTLIWVQAQWEFNQSVLSLGKLDRQQQHRLPEAVYSSEHRMINSGEYGVQLQTNRPRFQSDWWVDWQHFIWYGSPELEQIQGGVSMQAVVKKNQTIQLAIPAFLTAFHRGGQIDQAQKPLETYAQASLGVELKTYSIADSVVCRVQPIAFFNGSHARPKSIENGSALLSEINVYKNSFCFSVAHWYAHSFFAPMGDAQYQSLSYPDRTQYFPNRHLVVPSLFFSKKINQYVQFSIGSKVFYDVLASHTDYNIELSFDIRYK